MSKVLSHEAIQEALEELPGWSYEKDRLTKLYQFEDFSQALAFLVRVGLEAEKADHHPEIFNVYNRVRLALNTHDAGNQVTARDVNLAKAIETL